MKRYLVESALLAHGLKRISNEKLLSVWKWADENIVWIEQGEVCVGDMRRFCEFRSNADSYGRINYFNFDNSIMEKKTGCLTASGTMRVCEILNLPVVITCGIGGIMKGQCANSCNDIEALAKSNVSMVATAPKDMFHLQTTIDCMRKKGIVTCGGYQNYCDGYLFLKEKVRLDQKWDGEGIQRKSLYMIGIPIGKRINDEKILKEAYSYGKYQERMGKLFHPAVNEKIDELTKGWSSKIQLESLMKNIKWVENI